MTLCASTQRLDPEQMEVFVREATRDGWQLIASRVDRGEMVLEAIEASEDEGRCSVKSKYQKKQQRKGGKGRIDPRWQWWFERGTTTKPDREEASEGKERKHEEGAA